MYLCRPEQCDKTIRLDLESINVKYPESFVSLSEIWMSLLTMENRPLRQLFVFMFTCLIENHHKDLHKLIDLFLSAIDPQSSLIETKPIDCKDESTFLDFHDMSEEKMVDAALLAQFQKLKPNGKNEFSENAFIFRVKCTEFVSIVMKHAGNDFYLVRQTLSMIVKIKNDQSIMERAKYALIMRLFAALENGISPHGTCKGDEADQKESFKTITELSGRLKGPKEDVRCILKSSAVIISSLMTIGSPDFNQHVLSKLSSWLGGQTSNHENEGPKSLPHPKLVDDIVQSNPTTVTYPVILMALPLMTSIENVRPHAITRMMTLIIKCWSKPFVQWLQENKTKSCELMSALISLAKKIHGLKKEFNLVHKLVRTITADKMILSESLVREEVKSLAEVLGSCDGKSSRYTKRSKTVKDLLSKRTSTS
ncbi:hypothetical protein ACOME3_004179 [Neoechinorhynchus agilis]